MSNLLFVTSSLMAENSKSRQVAAEFVEGWKAKNAGAAIVERHLTPANMPHLDMGTLGALGTPADKRSDAQQQAVDFADGLIAEVEKADVVVLAVPMYNFSVPSTLKAWLDHIARAGRTFRYTEKGPEGLLKNKKVFAVVSRGGVYTGDSPYKPADHQEPYLRTILGFVGLTDVTFVPVEGQAVGADAAAKGIASARKALAEIVPLAA